MPRGKLTVVHNWVSEDAAPDVAAVDAQELRATWDAGPDDFVLMYAGNHGQAQHLEPVIETFAGMPGDAACHLVLVGAGVTKARLVELSDGHERIHFLDPVPSSEIARLMQASDAQLVSLADRPLFAVTMPSKVQSILAAGLPVVVVARGDAADVVTSAGAGVAVDPGDRQGLREAVRRLAQTERGERREMGRRGRSWYDAHSSREVGVRRPTTPARGCGPGRASMSASVLLDMSDLVVGGACRSERPYSMRSPPSLPTTRR